MPEKLQKVVLLAMPVKDKSVSYFKVEFYAFDEGLFPSKMSGGDDDLVLVSGTDAGPCPFVAKHTSLLDHCHRFAAFMANKSRMYYAGGVNSNCRTCHQDFPDRATRENNGQRSVFCMDTATGSEWTRLPLMTYGRWVPQLHVLDGALYAIGGMKEEQSAFMEVLPENEDEWITLPDPPCPVKRDYHNLTAVPVVVDEKPEDSYFLFVLLPKLDVFYTYTPKSNSWAVLDSSSIPGLVPHTFAFDSRFVYLYTDIKANAHKLVWHNIRLGQYHEVDLLMEGMIPPSAPFPEDVGVCEIALFHVGGNEFGLLWVDACDMGKGSDGYWCCRFTFDYKRALAGLKCCSLLWYSRCIGPKRPIRAVLAVDVPDHSTKGGHYHEGHYVSTPKQVLERRDGAEMSEREARSKQ
ncbi:unnamed protein product [Cuscuta campestris]|uniref:F-box associated domain-containing protein n=1 Tax=Cuscuta campestris TaxID=132261 RepID=A0A484NP59_9ASTE|nr:unnamed protein product [Cuscuta campestris]